MVSIRKWLLSFLLVLVKPLPRTFRSITQDVKGSFGSSIAWITFITIVFFIAIGQLGYFEGRIFANLVYAVLLIPICILLFVYLLHKFNQKLFHSEIYCYEELLYTTVVIFVLTTLINLVPIVFQIDKILLNWALVIYPIGLVIVGVKSITKVNIWQSTINVFISLAISVVGFVFLGFFLISLIQIVPSIS